MSQLENEYLRIQEGEEDVTSEEIINHFEACAQFLATPFITSQLPTIIAPEVAQEEPKEVKKSQPKVEEVKRNEVLSVFQDSNIVD